MSKIVYLIILIALGVFIYLKIFKNTSQTITQKIGDKKFSLEVVSSPFQIAKGLSNREELCSECGMLFKFNQEMIQTFWMKNTLIPLDMIFLNQSGQITDIYTATPEPNTPDSDLKLYQSTAPSKYVIEVNANTASNLGLKKGDHINLNL